MSGLLGIWNNINTKLLYEYEDWYNNEHLLERLNVSSIQFARRFVSLKSNYSYFTSYEATTYKTFFSDEYIKKLNNPTKKTKFVMESVFRDMSRTVFERERLNGQVRGSFCLIIALTDKIKKDSLVDFEKNNNCMHKVYSEIWLSKEIQDYTLSKEEQLRGKDRKYNSCLYIEFTNPDDAIFSMKEANSVFNEAEIGTYQLISTLI